MSYKADLLLDLKSLDYCAKYLRAAIVDSTEAFLVALRDVGEAQQGMTKLASVAGVNRENLYRMLSGRGNPRLNNLKAVLDAIGLQIDFTPAGKDPSMANSEAGIRRHLMAAPEWPVFGPTQHNTSLASGCFITDIGSIRTGTWSGGQGTTVQPWMPFSDPVVEEHAYSLLPGFLDQPSTKPFLTLPT